MIPDASGASSDQSCSSLERPSFPSFSSDFGHRLLIFSYWNIVSSLKMIRQKKHIHDIYYLQNNTQ